MDSRRAYIMGSPRNSQSLEAERENRSTKRKRTHSSSYEVETPKQKSHRLTRSGAEGPMAKGVVNVRPEVSKSSVLSICAPFSKAIMSEAVPRDFQIPSLPKFDGKGDSQEHVFEFEATMQLYDNLSDAIKARVFLTTLMGLWFSRLEEASIKSYEDLTARLMRYFVFRRYFAISRR